MHAPISVLSAHLPYLPDWWLVSFHKGAKSMAKIITGPRNLRIGLSREHDPAWSPRHEDSEEAWEPPRWALVQKGQPGAARGGIHGNGHLVRRDPSVSLPVSLSQTSNTT